MSSNLSIDWGRRALDFVAAVQVAATRDEVVRLTVAELERFGLPFITSWAAREGAATLRDTIDLNTRPAAYVDRYLDSDMLLRDPIQLAMRHTLATLTWTQVRALHPWSRAEIAIVDEGRDFGATDGITVPIFSNNLLLGAFSACGWKPELPAGARAAFQVVAMTAHQALMRSGLEGARREASHASLTPREREVLRWVANGKTNEDIGDILGIAAATVKTMLARAQSKLNASGRTHAVVQALRLGELDLNL